MNQETKTSSMSIKDSPEYRTDDRFLVGRTVYLRSPDIEKDVIDGEWHSWFNDKETTRFLLHGVFPVTKNDQIEIVKAAMKDKSTLLLCIIDAKTDKHVGVISLKNIDLLNCKAEIGIVTAARNSTSGVGAFEAMALLMKHSFYRLNMKSLHAGQHEGLWKWVNSLSMLGFRINGYNAHGGVRDNSSYGIFHTSVSAVDFLELEQQRGGDILNPSPFEVLRNRPKQNPIETVKSGLKNINCKWLTT